MHGLNLNGPQTPAGNGETSSVRQPRNASLLSFYREVSTMVDEQFLLDRRKSTFQPSASLSPSNQMVELALETNLEHARNILRDSLPPQDVSQRLLNLFFNYQNSIFYVCNVNEAQAQLALMYEDSSQVSISSFCQMFLILSVAVQFDDLNDTNGVTYHEIGKRYMDDAVEENPQDTLWVIRAMLLICFYHPSTEWASIWIYLGTITVKTNFELNKAHN